MINQTIEFLLLNKIPFMWDEENGLGIDGDVLEKVEMLDFPEGVTIIGDFYVYFNDEEIGRISD